MRILTLLFLLFSSLSIYAQSAAEMYIAKFDSLALEVMNSYSMPASLVLGIALHESGAGTSKLCRIKHNHFGTKSKVRSSKSKSGYVYSYRKFESDEAAYLYFGKMISEKKYYLKLKGDMDYLIWLKAMKAAKYATSSLWVSQVEGIIKRYDLTRYDIIDQDQNRTNTTDLNTIPLPAR